MQSTVGQAVNHSGLSPPMQYPEQAVQDVFAGRTSESPSPEVSSETAANQPTPTADTRTDLLLQEILSTLQELLHRMPERR